MLSKWLRMNEYIYSNLGNDSIGTLSFESLIFLKCIFFFLQNKANPIIFAL